MSNFTKPCTKILKIKKNIRHSLLFTKCKMGENYGGWYRYKIVWNKELILNMI